jgi:hypothetical protein
MIANIATGEVEDTGRYPANVAQRSPEGLSNFRGLPPKFLRRLVFSQPHINSVAK